MSQHIESIEKTGVARTRRSATWSSFRQLARTAVAVGLAGAVTLALAGTADASPDDPLDDAPLASSAGAPQSAYSGDELQIARSFAAQIIELADQDWSRWFTENGLQEPHVGYDLVDPGETYTSNCHLNGEPMVVTSDTPNAFYCSADTRVEGFAGTIVIPVTALRRIWDGDLYNKEVKNTGDFTVASIIAHEFGHHVADELVTQRVFAQEPGTVKNVELLADCFAGNWVASAYGQGYLAADPEGYIAQAIDALETLGDYEVGAPGHHGTPAERSAAIRIGIYGTAQNPVAASPQNCTATYWM